MRAAGLARQTPQMFLTASSTARALAAKLPEAEKPAVNRAVAPLASLQAHLQAPSRGLLELPEL